MRVITTALVLGLILMSCPSVKADVPDAAHVTLMPTVEVSNQPLEKVLDQIRTSVPSFHFVVFRSPSAPAGYPKLPVMSVDGITIEQFLDLVKDEYPAVKVLEIQGDKSPLYSIRIEDPAKQANFSTGPGGHNAQSPAAMAMQQRLAESDIKIEYAKADLESKQVDLKRKQELFHANAASQSEVEQAELAVKLAHAQVDMALLEHDHASAEAEKIRANSSADDTDLSGKPVVKVYRLDDIVTNLKAESSKKGLDDVLSLVQAALDEAGGDQPALKVHQATQMLVFKGTPAQMQLVEQVLDALRPKESDQTMAVRAELDACRAALDRSKEELQETATNLRGAIQDRQMLQMQLVTYKAEAEEANRRLAEAHRASTQPSK